ncbi:MAG TPA: nucleotidyltransferase [Ignavibacteriales bacterium]|nr:nucleotidyltransferase [Ignavibacteriales bacterium]
MERSKVFLERLSDFSKSLASLDEALNLDLSKFNEIELDLVKNGQIQKFEYSIELYWKIIKTFLIEQHGIETVSPKSAIKEFFGVNLIDEEEYELLIQMIDDRNRLSHIYNELFFNEIYSRLVKYLSLMQKVIKKIQ